MDIILLILVFIVGYLLFQQNKIMKTYMNFSKLDLAFKAFPKRAATLGNLLKEYNKPEIQIL